MLMTMNPSSSPRSKNTWFSLSVSIYLKFAISHVSILYKQEVFFRLYCHKLFLNIIMFLSGLLDKSGKHGGRWFPNSGSLDSGLLCAVSQAVHLP